MNAQTETQSPETQFDPQIVAHLEEHGYAIIPNALTPEEVEACRTALNTARANGWEEGLNEVGNMWFDVLLEKMPDTFAPLVAHPSVRPYLEALMGAQCQLRSFRGHINPGPYTQEWHMDFYGYWHQSDAPYAVQGTGINTTFYFQDNAPGIARLTFVKNGHRVPPPRELFNETGWTNAGLDDWAPTQELETIYPKAGDVVIFFSHIPHQGAKENPEVERSNIVCHYQSSPFYEGIAHVSTPRGFHGTFPLAGRKAEATPRY